VEDLPNTPQRRRGSSAASKPSRVRPRTLLFRRRHRRTSFGCAHEYVRGPRAPSPDGWKAVTDCDIFRRRTKVRLGRGGRGNWKKKKRHVRDRWKAGRCVSSDCTRMPLLKKSSRDIGTGWPSGAGGDHLDAIEPEFIEGGLREKRTQAAIDGEPVGKSRNVNQTAGKGDGCPRFSHPSP